MMLTVNGEKRDLTGVANVKDLLAAFKLEQKIVVVELNRAIVAKDTYEATLLREGDQLEIVHFVGGG